VGLQQQIELLPGLVPAVKAAVQQGGVWLLDVVQPGDIGGDQPTEALFGAA
jgi:hypothetical protein